MASILRNSHLWPLRVIAMGGLAFVLVFGSFTPVFAEEAASEPAAEEPSSEPAADYVPPPEAFEGLGGWAEVDPTTGEVLTVVVGNVNSMEDWLGMKARMAASGKGTEMRFQTRATPDGNVAGYGAGSGARFDSSSGNFIISGRSDDSTTSQTLVPSQTSRNADGTGRSYNIGSGIVDIKSDKTFRSGDTSVDVRTYRSDYQASTLDVTIALPDLGPRGSLLSYGLQFRTEGLQERPAALDQILTDVDSLLADNGYVSPETSEDGVTGEETTTETIDSDNAFVIAVRQVTVSVVEFLSSLLGFGRS